MAVTPEGAVKKKVDVILKKYGVWFFKPMSHGFSVSGVPDYVCCAKGRFFAVECKAREDLKPTALQEMQMESIRQADGMTFVIHPGNIELFEEEVRMICS